MNELELLIDFHLHAERQGPGSKADTLKALAFMQLDPGRVYQLLDIGCGSGAQTLDLAQQLAGHITGVDLFSDFLMRLESRALQQGFQDNITTLTASMEDLPFPPESFDVIWSEGAIYNMGFEAGVRKWKSLLKAGGYLAVSEITWLTHSRPEEIDTFWRTVYPQIDTASAKISILEQNGYIPIGYFFLPESSWMDSYYLPMEMRFETFLDKHGRSEAAISLVKSEREEIQRYRKYKSYYSYGFYVAQKASL